MESKRISAYSNRQLILKKVLTIDLFNVGFISSIIEDILCVEHNKNKFKIFKNLIYEVENEYVLLNVSSKDLNAYKINFDKYDKLTPSRKKFFERRGFFRTSKKALSSSKRMISILSKDMKEVGFLDKVGGRFINIYTKFTYSQMGNNEGYHYKLYKSRAKGFDNAGNIILNISSKKVDELRRFQNKLCPVRIYGSTYLPISSLSASIGIGSSGCGG